MSTLATPIHTGRVNGREVRFFRGPSGQPEMPWHSTEDLYLALRLPRELRRSLAHITRATWGNELRTIATKDGIATIAPHYVAQGLIGAAIEAGGAAESILSEYAMAGGAALKELTGDLPMAATIEYAATAFRRTNGMDGGAA